MYINSIFLPVLPFNLARWFGFLLNLYPCLQALASHILWWARKNSLVWSLGSAAPCSAGFCRKLRKERASLWRSPTWRFITRRSETCSTPKGKENILEKQKCPQLIWEQKHNLKVKANRLKIILQFMYFGYLLECDKGESEILATTFFKHNKKINSIWGYNL